MDVDVGVCVGVGGGWVCGWVRERERDTLSLSLVICLSNDLYVFQMIYVINCPKYVWTDLVIPTFSMN